MPVLFPFFGNPAIRTWLTRGFAFPPHSGFAFIGKEPYAIISMTVYIVESLSPISESA